MVDEVSAKYLVCRIKISSAEQVLEPASCERLVLFGHLFLLFLRRPHWGARAQSSARRGLDILPLDGLPRTPSRRSSQNASTRQLVVLSPYAVCADTGMLTPHARIAVPLSPQRRSAAGLPSPLPTPVPRRGRDRTPSEIERCSSVYTHVESPSMHVGHTPRKTS